MIELSLARIAAATGGRVVGDPERTVDAVATDSRTLPAGATLFVALRGEHADGHRFVDAAAHGGAAAALVERPVDGIDAVVVDDTWRAIRDLGVAVRRQVAPTAVAITGSVGKTTVKDLTAAAVGAGRRVAAARGSFNNELGVPLTLLTLREHDEVLVAEIGARHVGDIADLAPLVAPDVSVVTAVAGVHLEIFGSIEAIERAKGELVEALGPDGLAILNAADPRVRAMAARAPAALTVGAPGADLTAEDVTLDASAYPRFTARTPWGSAEVRLATPGRHQVGNALLALAVAGHLGVDLTAAAAALGGATISPWRGEVTRRGGLTVLNDAYNANPTSVIAALDTLTALAAGTRTVAVLGEMAEIGPTSSVEHARVGAEVAGRGIDRLVVVGVHAAPLADGAVDAGMAPESVVTVPDARAAAEHLLSDLAAGDVVLVKASRVAGLEQVADRLLADDAVEVDQP
ncbi:UDP-N-acetylmuramoyl-tripeptide--D-alanyl-D-alanine ligase [Nitriliruptor alkaliphilus]|uniref:UDP-N-acetylmuramoyl-tripeptide--D-alanyl-D- alanine ligase n=1 Tax=Nitriliruptor alkaliphilus TaxID=427918 RepID=UPI0006961C4C|nr:UDP-N-acetylmuramoyl-tripeptide--D-alanyl-D-alanine ligase [Nitriliruptor alkaliphilus]